MTEPFKYMPEFVKYKTGSSLELAGDDVHLWLARTDIAVDPFLPMLSSDEVERADRYIVEKDRSAFIVSRALLRSILAAYTKGEAKELVFEKGEFGKPALKPTEGVAPLYFNSSDSKSMMLVAVSRSSQVGADIEYVERERSFIEIAERFFNPNEAEKIKKLSPALRREAFYRCWTLKEAVVKATGRGLKSGLESFEVAFLPGVEERLLSYKGEGDLSPDFTVKGVYNDDGYTASIAVDGPLGSLTLFRL